MGTLFLAPAILTVRLTSCWTPWGVPPVNQTACGVSVIFSISAASALCLLEISFAICSVAP